MRRLFSTWSFILLPLCSPSSLWIFRMSRSSIRQSGIDNHYIYLLVLYYFPSFYSNVWYSSSSSDSFTECVMLFLESWSMHDIHECCLIHVISCTHTAFTNCLRLLLCQCRKKDGSNDERNTGTKSFHHLHES
jgi:hypothetical protein